jgi:hypothetical protein
MANVLGPYALDPRPELELGCGGDLSVNTADIRDDALEAPPLNAFSQVLALEAPRPNPVPCEVFHACQAGRSSPFNVYR